MIQKAFYVFVVVSVVTSQPLLFPHGWFESKNLRPRDAIMLNMMAQSNLEYGGVTLEELDKLDAVRKQIPRPEKLARDREEDDVELDRKPAFTVEGEKIEEKKEEKASAENMKKPPFRRVQLKLQKSKKLFAESSFLNIKFPERETEGSETEVVAESANPFEEIATRSPPRDWMSMRQLRNRSRKNKKKKRRYRKNGFLTRDDIIKSKKSDDHTDVKIVDRKREKAEFDEKLRNHAQETWERENKAAEEVREEMKKGPQVQNESEPISPAMKLLAKEHSEIDRRISIAEQMMTRKMDRLPNNPFSNVDLRNPTVLSLPLPPLEKLTEEDS
ncbi:hypothetical protein CAEBREN_31677 [Caenorhabditis brenneri]|uniref:Uncharacterized protein n=1 Tax=Caenorhabditis brenneri TaxID=135651 RepID=G0P8Q8_CAEBE|nr:hypothetical protein CAEBREN_31677 [Caenorhabditis brenneri]